MSLFLMCRNLHPPPTVKEKPDTVWQTRDKKEKDIALFCKIANEALDINIGDGTSTICDAVRLGGIRNDGRPRLLRVTFRDLNTKREILGKAKLLKRGRYKNVYINPDLTPEQRKIDSQLRATLKSRKDNGEINLVIRRGKIEVRTADNGNSLKKAREEIEKSDDDLSMADLEDEKVSSDSGSDSDISVESISSVNLPSDNPDKESNTNDYPGKENEIVSEYEDAQDSDVIPVEPPILPQSDDNNGDVVVDTGITTNAARESSTKLNENVEITINDSVTDKDLAVKEIRQAVVAKDNENTAPVDGPRDDIGNEEPLESSGQTEDVIAYNSVTEGVTTRAKEKKNIQNPRDEPVA